jgi:mono/diheme cytochrome c family protein
MTPRNGHVGRWFHALPVAAVISVGVAGACGSADRANGNAPPSELQEGRDIYRSRCASCHGGNGGGGVGPALAGGRVVARYPDIADNIAVIRDGSGSMPSFGGVLTPAEIDAVARYARENL